MIEINNISVRYRSGGKLALSLLTLHIGKGEYVAVMGPNGSGKSTLIRVICGLVGLEDGEVSLLGKSVRPGYFGDDFLGTVGAVFQEPEGQFLMRDVKTEIISVLQNLGLSREAQSERFKAIVEGFALSDILNKKPENLSGGQMQIVNLACALSMQPEILILDEPTTYLDQYYQKTLLDHLDSLYKEGMTILHVTQYAAEAARAGRTCILEEGKLVLDSHSNRIFTDLDSMKRFDLTPPVEFGFKQVFGFNLDELDSANSFFEGLKPKEPGEITEGTVYIKHLILSSSNLGFGYPHNDFHIDVDNLEIYEGEVIGLIGATGSGKSTLAFLLAGMIEPGSGIIEYQGKPLSSFSAGELRKKIGISWQLSDLAMLGPTVQDDIEFILKNLSMEKTDPAAILKKVSLNGFEDRIVDTLSGGEKRKLSLAGILAADPELLILDEPTAFLDPYSQSELAEIIQRLAGEGRSIIIAGHDLHFISKLAVKILGIKGGRIVSNLPAIEFFSDIRHSYALDLPPDPMIAFRQTLAKRGYHLPFASLEPALIKSYLDKVM
jgi:energy-coupling factor transporter ATP-binding protein EcfA2